MCTRKELYCKPRTVWDDEGQCRFTDGTINMETTYLHTHKNIQRDLTKSCWRVLMWGRLCICGGRVVGGDLSSSQFCCEIKSALKYDVKKIKKKLNWKMTFVDDLCTYSSELSHAFTKSFTVSLSRAPPPVQAHEHFPVAWISPFLSCSLMSLALFTSLLCVLSASASGAEIWAAKKDRGSLRTFGTALLTGEGGSPSSEEKCLWAAGTWEKGGNKKPVYFDTLGALRVSYPVPWGWSRGLLLELFVCNSTDFWV